MIGADALPLAALRRFGITRDEGSAGDGDGCDGLCETAPGLGSGQRLAEPIKTRSVQAFLLHAAIHGCPRTLRRSSDVRLANDWPRWLNCRLMSGVPVVNATQMSHLRYVTMGQDKEDGSATRGGNGAADM